MENNVLNQHPADIAEQLTELDLKAEILLFTHFLTTKKQAYFPFLIPIFNRKL